MFGSRKDKDTFMYPDLAVYIDESSEDFMLKGNKHKQKEELFDNNLNGKAPIIIFKPKYLQEVAEKFENDNPILPYWEPENTI